MFSESQHHDALLPCLVREGGNSQLLRCVSRKATFIRYCDETGVSLGVFLVDSKGKSLPLGGEEWL